MLQHIQIHRIWCYLLCLHPNLKPKPMKKTILFLGLSIGMVLALSSCGKKGCTDQNANNYCDKCKKDDGSCTYKGQFMYWWKQPFRDSCVAYGVANVQVFFDNTFAGTMAVSAQYWSTAPSCGASSVLTVTKDLGKNKNATYGYYYKLLDGSANVIATSPTYNA